jgi:hypothetical protein
MSKKGEAGQNVRDNPTFILLIVDFIEF